MRRACVVIFGLAAACGPSSACGAWASTADCALPPLTELAVPALPEAAQHVVLDVDAQGACLVAVASAGHGVERVTVMEERGGALVARDWPGALDAVIDMPSVATGPDGAAAVALRVGADGASGDVLVATRTAGGVWREPARTDIVSFAPRAYEPRVLFEASGALLVVVNQWSETRMGYGVGISRAPSVDAPLVRPRDADDALSPPLFFSNSPRPALDARGGGIVTWYQSMGGVLRVLFAERADDAVAFTHADPSAALSLDGTPVDSAAPPDPAVGADGTAAVAWGQEDGRGGVAVYLALRRGEAAFEVPRSLDERLSVGDGVARGVDAAVGDDGTVLVAWSERGASHERVYLAQIAPGAPRASAEVRLVSEADLDADSPALAVSPRGEVALAFVERASPPRLVLRRGTLGGALAPSEGIAAGPGVAGPVLAFGRAQRRFALAWVGPDGAHLAATALGSAGP